MSREFDYTVRNVTPVALLVDVGAGSHVSNAIRDMLALSLEWGVPVRGAFNTKPLNVDANEFVKEIGRRWDETPFPEAKP